MDAHEQSVAPAPSGGTVVSITVGVDGRIYCHDLPPELLPVLTELCVPEGEFRARQAALDEMECPHG